MLSPTESSAEASADEPTLLVEILIRVVRKAPAALFYAFCKATGEAGSW
jgi:hypothetical protein